MALAAAAGIAVENARLYESGQHRQRSLEVSTRVATDLLAGRTRTAALNLVAASARELSGADLATVVIPDEAGHDFHVAAAADEARHGRVSAQHSLTAAVMASGRPELVPDARTDPRVDRSMVVPDLGPRLLLPLTSDSVSLGVLIVAKQGRTGGPRAPGGAGRPRPGRP